jgi:PASTA domain
MTFVALAVVVGIVALAAGFALGRRGRAGTRSAADPLAPGPVAPNPVESGPATVGAPAGGGPTRPATPWLVAVTAISAVALVVAGIALARSGGHGRSAASSPTTTSSTTTTTVPEPAGSTTPSTQLGGTVSVPNVVGTARNVAVATLEKAGLKVSVDTLALANVPPGFVISQNPLPAGLVMPGATVALVVSASN